MFVHCGSFSNGSSALPSWKRLARTCWYFMGRPGPKAGNLDAGPLPGCSSEVSLAMIDAIGSSWRSCGLRSADAYLDRVDAAVSLWRRKRQTVFVADELRDLGVGGIKFLFVSWEVGAATGGFRHAFQQLIRSFQLQCRLGRNCGR